MIRRLVFIDDGRWLMLDGDAVTARGAALDTLPPLLAGDAAETIIVVPGDAVVLHWVELPELAPAQMAAAARMLAADVSAAPIETTHVVVGAADGEGVRPLALVDREVMAGWLAQLDAAGIDADRMVPAPFLLPVSGDAVRVFEREGLWLVRGERLGFAAESELARMMVGERATILMSGGDVEAGLAAALDGAAIDLRQGAFARVRAWSIDRRRVRRLAVLAAALLAAVLATEVAAVLRYSFAADRAEMQLAEAARRVLPRGTVVGDARGQVAARLARLGGDGGGFGGPAAALMAAMRDRPGVVLQSLEFAPESGLVVVVTGDAADRDAVVAAVSAAGFATAMAAAREQGGMTVADVTVRAR